MVNNCRVTRYLEIKCEQTSIKMVNFLDMFKNFMFIGLMVFCILAFIVTTQLDNSVSDPIINDPLINSTYSNLGTNLGEFRNQSQAQKNLFESENPTIGLGSILLFSILSAGKVFGGMIIGTFNVLVKLPLVVLGLDPILLSLFGTLLIVTIILSLWAVYKLGG